MSLAICAILTNEIWQLRQWIEFHRIVGVDHFYLYQNQSQDDWQQALLPFIKQGIVQMTDWPTESSRSEAFEHFIDSHRPQLEWVAFLDSSTFMFSPGYATVSDALSHIPTQRGSFRVQRGSDFGGRKLKGVVRLDRVKSARSAWGIFYVPDGTHTEPTRTHTQFTSLPSWRASPTDGDRIPPDPSSPQTNSWESVAGPTALHYEQLVEACRKVHNGVESRIVIEDRNYVARVRESLNYVQSVERRYRDGCAQGDMKDFLPWLRQHAKGTVLEIGVRDGASTSALLLGVENNGGVVLSVDKQDCSQVFPEHPLWKFIWSDSHNPQLQVPELDIVLIDGDHTRDGYRADLEHFYPLVKSGGMILSHDIAPEPGQTLEDVPDSEYPSVAVKEEYFRFCQEKRLQHYELPGMYGFGVMRKP